MRLLRMITLLCAGPVLGPCAGMAQEGRIVVPSGLGIQPHELILEPQGVPSHLVKTVRVRLIAKALSDAVAWPFAKIEQDFETLCNTIGLRHRTVSAPNAEKIIISLASEATRFGESSPQTIQYFDTFLVENDGCRWEGWH